MPKPTHDLLQEHASGIRALAFGILHDEGLADDVVQDTWIAAITHPPIDDRSPRGWLYVVARNLARRRHRTENRRRIREQQVARPERLPSAAELAARMQLKKRMIHALNELREPYRSTLILRYFDDLTPSVIAERQCIPIKTVKSRLYRGLQSLRDELDDEHEGRRVAWTTPLAGLAAMKSSTVGTSSFALGGLVMKNVAIVAGLALILGATWFVLQSPAKEELQPIELVQAPAAPPPIVVPAVVADTEEVTPPADVPAPTLEVRREDPPKSPVVSTPERPAVRGALPLNDNTFVVVGRVVNEMRAPVVGAYVTVHNSSHEELSKGSSIGVQSDQNGEFVIRDIPHVSYDTFIVVVAKLGARSGLAGAMAKRQRTRRLDLGTIGLRPSHDLRVQVKRPNGTNAVGAKVWVEALPMHVNGVVPVPSIVAMKMTSDEGLCTFSGLPKSTYRLMSTAEGLGRTTQGWRAGRSVSKPVIMTLSEERVINVKVIDAKTQKPIEGAHIEFYEIPTEKRGFTPQIYMPPRPALKTNTTGIALIHGIGMSDEIGLRVTAKGYPTFAAVRHLRPISEDSRTVSIALVPGRTVRWPVDTRQGEAPPDDGTELVVVTNWPRHKPEGEQRAWMEAGHIVVDGCYSHPMHIQVIAPDGSWAKLFIMGQRVKGDTVHFQRPRTVRVIVKHADGTPAPNRFVSIRSGGNQVLIEPTPTDVHGIVELSLHATHKNASVFVGTRESSYAGKNVGSLKLSRVHNELNVTLAPERLVEATVTVDGVARIPPGYGIRVNGQIVSAINETLAGSSLSFRVLQRPDATLKLVASAPGLTSIETQIPYLEDSQPQRIKLAFTSSIDLIVRVHPPKDGVYELIADYPFAERYHKPLSAQLAKRMEIVGHDGDWVVVRFIRLKQGLMRIGDVKSRAGTKLIEIKAGQPNDPIDLDLSKVGIVRGTVTVPTGHYGGEVHITGTNILPQTGHLLATEPGPNVSNKGTFAIRIPGDRPVTLKPWHRLLRPSATNGQVTLTQPTNNVRLRLERAPLLTFRLDQRHTGPSRRSVSVLVFGERAMGMPLFQAQVGEVDGAFSLAGIPTGTHSVVINPKDYAPIVINRVSLEDEDTHLGTLKLMRGSSLHIKVQAPNGQAPPWIYVLAEATQPFLYRRGHNSSGESTVVVPGLGKGTFRVRAYRQLDINRNDPLINKMIETNGKDDVQIELNMR